VAFSIVYLLPVDLMVAIGSRTGLAMVMALLIAAILWNLGTWYRGLPASSSHTLIGSIVGVGLANSLLPGHSFGSGVNWQKVQEIGLSLLLSPMLGFCFAGVLLLITRKLIRSKVIHQPPIGDCPPPLWMRSLLVFTCSGVSFAHGSNDGQKGIGLIMLILIGILPARHAVNPSLHGKEIGETVAVVRKLEGLVGPRLADPNERSAVGSKVASVPDNLAAVRVALEGQETLEAIPPGERWQLRSRVLQAYSGLSDVESGKALGLDEEQREEVKKARKKLRQVADYSPWWVALAVAIALGVGTTVGWKRIVVTVGEKIGKTHLTYAQGGCAELVAMTMIGLADKLGLPVSTTHVLSSGVAGTMAANRSGLQLGMVRSIALAWLLTLPVCITLSGGLFLLFRAILGG
jgi:PiT family inorganic phosphate transporter